MLFRLPLIALALSAPLLALAVEDDLPVDPDVLALRQLESSLAAGQLEQAQTQLRSLKQRLPGDTRLEQAQRSISAAYGKQVEAALKAGDLAGAEQKLVAAQQAGGDVAPLKAQLEQARSAQQAKEQAAAEQAAKAKAAAEAKAKAEAARSEQLRQQKLAAEQAAKQTAQAAPKAHSVAPAAAKAPLLLKKGQTSTLIALPMLDDNDREALRVLLDQVAQDLVQYQCTATLRVRERKDYPFVASLLSVRVKKLNPSFKLDLKAEYAADQAPQLSLTPKTTP